MGVFIVKLKKKKNYSNIDFCSLEGGEADSEGKNKKNYGQKEFLATNKVRRTLLLLFGVPKG